MKKTQTKTAKASTPKFTLNIDMTKCETLNDLLAEFAYTKLDNNIDINVNEVCAIVKDIIDDAIDDSLKELFAGHNALVVEDGVITPFDAIKVEVKKKKQNFFIRLIKRFWNWIRRK